MTEQNETNSTGVDKEEWIIPGSFQGSISELCHVELGGSRSLFWILITVRSKQQWEAQALDTIHKL